MFDGLKRHRPDVRGLRRSAGILGAALILSGTCLPGIAQTEDQGAKPNILFITVDDLRPELGCYGSDLVQTPNIDRLARRGMVFTRAYAQMAMCNPSRASMLTGLRPDTIKIWDLQTHFRKNRPDIVTLPQLLMAHGYHTVSVGKIFHGTLPDPPSWSQPTPENPFNYQYLDPKTRAANWERSAAAVRVGKRPAWIAAVLRGPATECYDTRDTKYRDGATTDLAIGLLKKIKDKGPFLLAVGYQKPHLPFVAPKKYWDLYDRSAIPLAKNRFLPKNAPTFAMNTNFELACYSDFAAVPKPTEGSMTDDQARLLKHGYYACVSYIDAQVGRLLDALERSGLADNTIIVLLGDHGFKLGEHNSWGKQSCYEIDAHTSLIMFVPGAAGMGRTCGALVELIDIYPTLCDLTGLEPPHQLEGFSMAPLFDDPEIPWKSAVFFQFQGGFMGRYMGRSIRTERYRYVEWRDWYENTFIDAELYDLQTDPGEDLNIARFSESQELLQLLSRRLWQGWWGARPPVRH
jgi:arylsulfatase A-like enzyme